MDFSKNKENKEEKKEITFDHLLMGKLKFDCQWFGKFGCKLFGIEKEIGPDVYLDDDEPDDPLEKQENAYRYYTQNADMINKKIDAEIRNTFEPEQDFPLESRFEPAGFIIFPNGNCGFSFRDHEIDGEYEAASYIVFSVLPKVAYEGSEHDYYGL